jgi:hypothetical protein
MLAKRFRQLRCFAARQDPPNRASSSPSQQSADERHQKQNQENEKQNLGDPYRCRGDSQEPKYRSDKRDHKKRDSPLQHGASCELLQT